MQITATDIPMGVDFIHVDGDGWKTTHHPIRKTIYPEYIELNQYKYAPDDIIEVVRFDNPKDEQIAKQAEQIAISRAALITEKSYHAYYKCQGDCDKTVCSAGSHKAEAKKQLAQEYPAIFGDDPK